MSIGDLLDATDLFVRRDANQPTVVVKSNLPAGTNYICSLHEDFEELDMHRNYQRAAITRSFITTVLNMM
jgi:hypothetical protein